MYTYTLNTHTINLYLRSASQASIWKHGIRILEFRIKLASRGVNCIHTCTNVCMSVYCVRVCIYIYIYIIIIIYIYIYILIIVYRHLI